MSRHGHDRFINDLPLMRSRKATLPGQFAKLFVSRRHGGDSVLDENDYSPGISCKVKSWASAGVAWLCDG